MTPLLSALESSGAIQIEDRFEQPQRSARFTRLAPKAGALPGVSQAITALTGKDRLWRHQANSLDAVFSGQNVVVATGTASGKSLVFQVPVIASILSQETRHIVLYPAKALAADQAVRWKKLAQDVGLDPVIVQEINGDVPYAEREHALANAKIIIATPDVLHAWFLPQIANPLVQLFLRQLRFIVIDEAHALEGSFGTSCAYFFRRLKLLSLLAGLSANLSFIAASATVRDPALHLASLTGEAFVCIDEKQNGAPRAGVTLAHIAGPSHGAAAEAQLASVLLEAILGIGDNAFIAFADSRQGVERIARRIAREDVLPYRSGYEARDRRQIEDALRRGSLKGVISTSALELGIDIPQFTLGINLGLPQSRKALKQRIGRIGRTKPGLFLLMAPPTSFAQLGTSFKDYVTGEVEPSPLYLDNQFIQYAQARCLLEELGMSGAEGDDLLGNWPESFKDTLAQAKPGAQRSRELDVLALNCGDSPHHSFPLRQICDQQLALKIAGFDETLGTISLAQAIREAYPGATYYHLQRPHRVTQWRVNSYERTIYLKPRSNAQPTQPVLRNKVRASFAAEEIIAGRLLRGSKGSVAEVRLQVAESVEGFRSEKGQVNYGYLRQTNPSMQRKSREFSTTGIIIQVSESWFCGARGDEKKRRYALGQALKEMLCRDHSIATNDIEIAASDVVLQSTSSAIKLDDALVLYDNLHGGLRLTAKLYEELPSFAERLAKAAEAVGEEALVDFETAWRFSAWLSTLAPATPMATGPIDVPEGEHLIFSPGSLVSFRKDGQTFERRLIGPEIFEFAAGKMLLYSYENDSNAKTWVAHDAVEPVGFEWSRVIWNPVTNVMRPCP